MEGSIFLNSINSFCGLNMFSSILINYVKDIKHKWFYGETDDDTFIKRFEVTVKALKAIKNLRASKIALVGGIAPGFNDLYFDERLGQKRFGIKIERGHEFSEISLRAEAYSTTETERFIQDNASDKFFLGEASGKNIETHYRYFNAYKDFADDYGYDALAISCWPQMAGQTEAYSCSIVGKLNQNGIVAACEGDLPGAVSMLLQKYIIDGPTTLMDLSGWDEKDQSILMWHCGPTAECYADKNGACLKYCHQPVPDSEDHNVTGMITNMVFKTGPVTFTRITGEWDGLFLLDGKVAEKQKESPEGSRAWIEKLRLNRNEINTRDLMNTILVRGMQHHYAMAAGDITEELLEVAAWLGLMPMEAVAYENYLQVIGKIERV
jgi:L-fucose isomerase-like protein